LSKLSRREAVGRGRRETAGGIVRRIGIIAAALVALLIGAPAASADVEPNNGIVQPEGPIAGGVAYTGALASDNDDDWYVFYVASQTQLDISFTTPGSSSCSTYATFRDSDGDDIDYASASPNATDHVLYTTPVGVHRYFLVVDSGCAGATYSFSLDPAAAIVPGLGATPAQPTSEPNENAGQAFGPFAGGTPYAGSVDTQNDQDWFYFYAAGVTPFDLAVTRTTGGCTPYVSLYRDNSENDSIDSVSPQENTTAHIVYTPTAGKYVIGVTASCAGASYRLQLDPAAAISLLAPPPPAPPAPPSPPVARAPTGRCTRARAGVVRWRGAIRRTRAKLQVVETRRARRHLRRKLGAQRRTFRRAKDRVTIYC
jgi:hypothetical protein